MVIISPNYITESESLEFIKFANENEKSFTHTNDNYWYNGTNILKEKNNFSFFNKINIHKYNPELLRIHKIDSNLNTPEVPHFDTTPFSFIIFLNDGYVGGELNFKRITITPTKYTIVYFTKDESHYIKKVTEGIRYTLVGFLNSPIGFDRKVGII